MIEKKFEVLAEEIAKWNKLTFPAAEEKGQLAKLDEEFKELRGAIKDETDFSVEVLGELADCFIVAAGLEFRFNNPLGGFLLWALIDKADEAGEVEAFYLAICTKMEINRRRNWSPMSNGAYHH